MQRVTSTNFSPRLNRQKQFMSMSHIAKSTTKSVQQEQQVVGLGVKTRAFVTVRVRQSFFIRPRYESWVPSDQFFYIYVFLNNCSAILKDPCLCHIYVLIVSEICSFFNTPWPNKGIAQNFKYFSRSLKKSVVGQSLSKRSLLQIYLNYVRISLNVLTTCAFQFI